MNPEYNPQGNYNCDVDDVIDVNNDCSTDPPPTELTRTTGINSPTTRGFRMGIGLIMEKDEFERRRAKLDAEWEADGKRVS